ncbi:hypothetical protein [Culturomica massiliensis]|uniref:hypothetical protein n=1 Tax=Culturomica massiliensis TaxID=1841857 RepID=UPI002355A013|nr:hypothetical protein [Culturomica massiliensis]
MSYPSYRIKVKIVPVANDLDEFEALRGELEKIYSRVGIECVVEKMPVFAYSSPLLFADKSGVFSAYTDEMKKLQGAYVENYGIDPEASYLFVLLYSGQGDDRNYTGFMPLNKQFGYLFCRDFGSFEEFAVAAAHELAHGRLSLRHPFDKSLGLPEGSVADNLMDYRHGRELAKWQWDVIHDPGIVVRVFERDEDAAIKGAFYDGIALAPLVDYKYRYNFGDIYSVESKSVELTCGRYNLTAHYNVDHDNHKKLSYYLAWREILKDGTPHYRSDYYVGAKRLDEFKTKVGNYSFAADVFFMNGVPPQNMLQLLSGLEIGDLSEVLGGLGDMWGDALSDPMWWINIVNGSVSPKFLKPAGKFMGSFIRGLGDGAISLLNKTGRLGYKIRHIAGEVALYTNLEIEIARFNSRGVLRPLHWGEAIGEKVLSLEDDVRFLKDEKEFSGRLVLYRNNNTCVWVLPKFVVGDKIGTIAIERVKVGRSDKIAIIGRSMGNENMKGVKDAYMDLIQRGYDNVEIFDPLSLSDDWLNNFQLAEREMRKLSIQLGRYLNNEELAKTKMFQLNKKWAQKLVEESYTVIDLGDIPLKNDSYNGFSAFYAIEKKTIFGK